MRGESEDPGHLSQAMKMVETWVMHLLVIIPLIQASPPYGIILATDKNTEITLDEHTASANKMPLRCA
jgi:hypothetical protein